MNRQLINGDCLEELKKLDDNSVDLLCTDPPYGYGFMGKHWVTSDVTHSKNIVYICSLLVVHFNEALIINMNSKFINSKKFCADSRYVRPEPCEF